MSRRYYRRRSSKSAGALIGDWVRVGNSLSWWGAALIGLFFFTIFYWLLPIWLMSVLDNSSNSPLFTMLKQVVERKIHWLEYLGIVLGLVGLFFAVKNYFSAQKISSQAQMGVGLFSRIFGRFLD